MKSALAASFVLLFLLVEAQGIRLERGFVPVDHQRIQEEKESKLIEAETSGGSGAVEIVSCKDGHRCSGRNRKLLTEATSAPTTMITTAKSVKSRMNRVEPAPKLKSNHGGLSGGKDNLSVKKLGNSEQQKRAQDQEYPDIMDIAGMDYSTAKRKSPIHN